MSIQGWLDKTLSERAELQRQHARDFRDLGSRTDRYDRKDYADAYELVALAHEDAAAAFERARDSMGEG